MHRRRREDQRGAGDKPAVVAVPMRMASAVDMPRSRASTMRDTRNTS